MSRTGLSTAIAIAAALAAATSTTFAQTATPVSPVATEAPVATAGAITPSAPGAAGTPVRQDAAPPTVTGGVKPPADYVIGIDDALEVVYWREKDMSAAVIVRPDGNISLPLVNDILAAGLTPEELRQQVVTAASKFVEDPTVSVVVKAINSRKVYVMGQVAKPGPYPLMDSTSVLQMLATAGGLNEYAKSEKITVVRKENDKEVPHRFNYKNVSEGKSLQQNIELKPGDTIIVP
jgi:polysaccharide export outer membrane protein